jgi:hypothetical protein
MFPLEIIDLIILHTDFETSIRLNNEYTSKKLYNPDKNTWYWAAKNCHLDIVEWLHFNRKEGCSKYAMDLAAENGHFEIVKWLHENRKEGCTYDTYDAMEYAAFYGHLEVVEYLKKANKVE